MGLFSKLLWGSNPRATILASYNIPKKFRINPLTGTRISPDGSRVGYVLRLDEPSSETSALVVNGEMISPGSEVVDDCFVESGPDFNSDGSRVACGQRTDRGYSLLLARVDNPANPAITFQPVPGTVAGCVFLSKSNKVFYRVITFDRNKGQKFLLMSDGERISPDCDLVSVPYVSEDGEKIVYAATLDGKCYFVVNEKSIQLELYRAGTPVFSPDGDRFVFCAEKSEGLACLISYDLTKNKMLTISDFYSDVSSPSFNRDGTKVVYAADHRHVLVYDFYSQKTEKISGNIDYPRTPVFSPEGKTIAYVAKIKLANGVEVFHIFVNDQKITPFYADMNLATGRFSETGEVCYSAYEVKSKHVVIAKVG